MKHGVARSGFTLLEIILTVVIFAIVAAVGLSFFNQGVTRTDIAINQLQVDAQLQLVMENMIQDNNRNYPNNLSGFNTKLGNTGTSSVYASGMTGNSASYYLDTKQFVCPSNYTFTNSSNAYQFLQVTIKPSINSGVSLTYIFANNSNVNSCGS